MARSRLQKCQSCGQYGLGKECNECGGPMLAAAPIKFSPEDKQGERRRERKQVGSGTWSSTLPTLDPRGEEE